MAVCDANDRAANLHRDCSGLGLDAPARGITAMDSILYGGVAILVLIVLIRFFEASGRMIERATLENDRIRSENDARDAATQLKRSQAVQVLNFSDHFKGLFFGEPIEINGEVNYFIPVHVPPAPVTLNTGEVVSADELKLRRAAMQLIEASIVSYGVNGNQVEPANSIDGQLGVKWQDVIDYMQREGWVMTIDRKGTFCTAAVSNLAALRLSVAAKALPRRDR